MLTLTASITHILLTCFHSRPSSSEALIGWGSAVLIAKVDIYNVHDLLELG